MSFTVNRITKSYNLRIVIFILLVFSIKLNAQQPFSYKLDYEDGFESNEVYQIRQDSFGFIWIGCDAGLFRYDGVTFKSYKHPKQNGISISSLIVDKQQRVWCQNFTGQVFFIQNDTMHLFKDFTKETTAFPNYSIQGDRFIVVLTNHTEIYSITDRKLKSKYFNEDSELKEDFNTINIFASSTEIYINSRDNIHYKNENESYQNIFPHGQYTCYHLNKIDNEIYAILKNNQTAEWQISKIQKGQFVESKIFPPQTFSNGIYMMKSIEDGFIICTTNGVHLLNETFELKEHYFLNEKITDALFDKEGNLWLTSLQNGLYIIPSIELRMFSDDFFPNANITALAAKNNQLLLGTYLGNIYQFNPQNSTFQTLPIHTSFTFSTVKKIIENDELQVIAIGESTIAINKKTNETININAPNVKDMLIFKDTLFSVNIGAFWRTPLQSNREEVILPGAGRMITKGSMSDTIFLANKNGFYSYINGKTQEILKDSQSVYAFCSTWQEDTLWLGTLSDGFMAYHNGQFFHHFYQKKLGKGILIRAIKSYQNWLLLATNIGFIRMDLITKKMDIIGVSEGLYQKEITGIEVINDEIFLSTTNSLIRFPLNLKAKNTTIPNIRLHSITLNDSISISKKQNQFKYFENNLLLEFQTALFRSRQRFHYEYRLLGLNDNWQKTNASSPFVQYRSLDAGQYTFEVRAVNEDNIKSIIERYTFSVQLPIWERWWFILLSLLLIAALVYWWFDTRLKDIQQKAKLENDLKTSQLTALKAQMNPHFLYNSLNSIQDLILQEDVDNANEYLTKFSHLMRQILEASEFFEIPLSKELQILELYLTLEKLRFGRKFQYTIQLSNTIKAEQLKVPSMIIQPFVENAVKHGLLHKIKGLKVLNIDFELKDALICTITDNGIGRKEAEKINRRQGKRVTSFATSATEKRLNILNQTYEKKVGLKIIDLYENDQAIGTKVVLRIPFTAF